MIPPLVSISKIFIVSMSKDTGKPMYGALYYPGLKAGKQTHSYQSSARYLSIQRRISSELYM